MNISLSTLSGLQAGRSYYLSNTTGTIKRTNLWQWFKCVTGLGDGRAKAQQLAEVVKASLLANADLKEDAALSQDIARLDTTYSLSGASLREIAGRFKTAHADAVAAVDARREAFGLAERVAEAKIDEWTKNKRVLSTPDNLGYIRKIALYSVQHLVEQAHADRKIPKNLENKMGTAMLAVIERINTAEYMQSFQRSGMGYPLTQKNGESPNLPMPRLKFDELHFRAILAGLMTRNGPANSSDFIRRLRFFNEETLKQREKELIDIRLEPPETLLSGFVFAEKATKLCQAMQDAEMNPQNPLNIQ